MTTAARTFLAAVFVSAAQGLEEGQRLGDAAGEKPGGKGGVVP